MKRCLLLGVTGLALLTLAPLPAQPGKQAGQNGWLNNLDQAKALAQKNGKPLMVVFRCEP
jgi:hypothetical protein